LDSLVRLAAVAMLALSISQPAFALTADSAEDVCGPLDDPCVVSEVVRVESGAVLDFGTRDVSVTGKGSFNFGANSGRIYCGSFDATSRTPFDAVGFRDGALDSGRITLHARRQCSGSGYPCLDNGGCALGSCSTRRCAEAPAVTCSDDSHCQLGTCSALTGRCLGNFGVSCETNVDCDVGPCPAQLTCSKRPYDTVDCSSNADCQLGSCSVGDGSISIDGTIRGRSRFPAYLEMKAAGSAALLGPIHLSGTSGQSDGGELEVHAMDGSVSIAGRVRARGGVDGAGGDVELFASEDISVSGKIDLRGGDFDGGTFDAESGGDIFVESSIEASSRSGAGYGGDVLVVAGRDLSIGVAALEPQIRIAANGHEGRFGDTGDGGRIDLSAERDALIAETVSIVADGGMRGYGGDIILFADGDFAFDGRASASAFGEESGAGFVFVEANGTTSIGASAVLGVHSNVAGNLVEIYGGRGLEVAGTLETSGADNGILLYSLGTLSMSGSLSLLGDSPGAAIEACRVELPASARVFNSSGGTTRIRARESMRLLAGSVVETPEGTNHVLYRTADKPPVLNGTITPSPLLEVYGGTGCPVCGNGEVDYLETCDDGNVADGDGCSSLCQIE
jgi:cysteine-rich repeat protein